MQGKNLQRWKMNFRSIVNLLSVKLTKTSMNKYRLREILVYAYIMQVYTMSELRHSKPLTLVA